MSNVYVPIDLLRECLIRTPAESLVRFKGVSKQWSALISSKEFAREHLKSSLMKSDSVTSKVIIRTFDTSEGESCNTFKLLIANLDSPVDFIGTQKEVHNIHGEHGKTPIKLIGSCHGLICIKYSYDGLCLYNPCIKKFRNVPYFEPSHKTLLNGDLVAYGFGYDDVHDDYKVIKLIPCFEVFEIYSLKSNSWERFNHFSFTIPPNRSNSGVFVNSHIHWLNFDTNYDLQNYFSVIGIDVRTHGAYRVMKLPSAVSSYNASKSLGVLNDCLALFTSPTLISSRIQIWAMKQYGVHESWTLLTTIQLSQFVMNTYSYGLRLLPNKKIVIQHSMREIIWFDIKKNYATRVKIPGLEKASKEVYPIEYSLIDPNHI